MQIAFLRENRRIKPFYKQQACARRPQKLPPEIQMVSEIVLKVKKQSNEKNGKQPTVAVAIVTWNSAGEIRDCLRPLAGLPANWQVWVVDNNSSDDTAEIVRNEFPFVRLIANPDNRGFAEANNQIVAETETDYVLLLNPDTEATPEGLLKALEISERNPLIGILGAKLVDDEDNLQTTVWHFPTPFLNFINGMGLYRFFSKQWQTENLSCEFFDHNKKRRVDWLIGAFMLVRRDAIAKAGAVPEEYFMFAEDMDWCYRVGQSGYEVWFTPEVTVKHKHNRSAGQLPSIWRVEKTHFSKYVFCFLHYGWLATKFIQLTDFVAYNLGIWRLMLRRPEPDASKEWKMSRRVVWQSLGMTRKEISAKLNQR